VCPRRRPSWLLLLRSPEQKVSGHEESPLAGAPQACADSVYESTNSKLNGEMRDGYNEVLLAAKPARPTAALRRQQLRCGALNKRPFHLFCLMPAIVIDFMGDCIGAGDRVGSTGLDVADSSGLTIHNAPQHTNQAADQQPPGVHAMPTAMMHVCLAQPTPPSSRIP